ncbi:hypothetical protein [Bremerella sp. P1]|uniref:hypothetical protein n=1 Tax=Bremerella sp. P1 TaxID=3026424 RepID=UPI002368B5E8|nr:hypothetical protein [Bremerella sp. P1]WDI41262.1 hypothetical protein PSR63_22610 [Bremerella sp. P1]
MKVLRYTMPADLPCYTDWDFRVYPGRFDFLLDAMRQAFHRRIENDSKYAHMWSSKSGIHKEYRDCKAVLDWLDRMASTDAEVIEYDGSVRDLFWSMSHSLVYGGQYRQVYCPPCDRTFQHRHMMKMPWTFGEDLAAEGGHRLDCPKKHAVYSIMEWNS